MRIASFRTVLSCCAFALLVACGGGSSTPPPIPAPQPTPPPSSVTLAVERVFPNLSFSSPVAMLQAPGDTTRWFVVEQNGVVRVFDNVANVTASTPFIDITPRVRSGSELGLLGMAFHPDFATNGRVFLSYTNNDGPLVSRISEFRLFSGGATLDPASERMLLVINQPEENHNGGGIAFGLDRFLYIGMGDGGGGGDQHGAIGNGQNLQTLLGKMLRIDVTPALGYAIPSGNAFPATNAQCGVTGSGTQDCPEIFAFGFRNPWRWSTDRATGELWVGDVGQAMWEEVNRVTPTAGRNYGWRCREGAHQFNTNCGGATALVDPVAEYGRSAGTTVTGGYVYRGAAIPALQGRYVFGDFGSGNIWHIPGDTMPTLDVTNASAAPVLDTPLSISSFAEDNAGELYVVHYGSGGTTGTLHRLRAQ